jgi:hypothetical protein
MTNTMTVQGKIKKAVENILPAGDPIVYFIDEFNLQQWNQELDSVLRTANNLAYKYQDVTGYKISKPDDLLSLVNDPVTFYKDQHLTMNAEKFKEFISLKIEFTVSLPNQWDDVLAAARRFAKVGPNYIKQSYIEMKDNQFVATEKWYLRRNSKCYALATTRDEKQRVEFAQGVIAATEKLESRLKENPKLYGQALQRKLHFFPLPYFLKAVNTAAGVKIIPNPAFVLHEFEGTSHLGHYIATSAEKRMHQSDVINSVGERYIHFKRALRGGGHKLYSAHENEFEKYFNPASDTRVPGYFNELGGEWGEMMDMTRSRPMKETTWAPLR